MDWAKINGDSEKNILCIFLVKKVIRSFVLDS